MSVNGKILTWLETELFEGRLELGQNLPNDRKIASIVGASHSSTREALKQLEIMGILRLYEGKRKTIIARLVAEPFASAAPALRLHMSSSVHPTRDLVQTRILLESWAVAHAQVSDDKLQALEEVLNSMQRESILPQEFHQFEVNFHMMLVELSGNQLILGLMTSLRESIYEDLLSLMGRVPLWSATAIRLRAEYGAIIAALRNRDVETASQLVVSTIENQYVDADIDLDEATEVANELPGTRASMVPVEVEQDDLLPEQWEEAVSPQLIEALENIGKQPASALETEPDTELDAETALSAQHQEDSSPISGILPKAPSEIFTPLHSSPQYSEPEEQVTPLRPKPTQFRARVQDEASPRRRRGTVSSPVHATVIKPIDRSGQRQSSVPDESPTLQNDANEFHAASQLELETVETDSDLRQKPEVRKSTKFGKWLGWGKESNPQREYEPATEQEQGFEATDSADVAEESNEHEPAGYEQLAAPEGYEYADTEAQKPEFIDETHRWEKSKGEPEYSAVEETAELDFHAEKPKTSTINKTVKKKKRKR